MNNVIITTMEKLAEAINAADEWEFRFNRIIARNGWIDDSDKERDICHTATKKLTFNDLGKAVVVEAQDDDFSALDYINTHKVECFTTPNESKYTLFVNDKEILVCKSYATFMEQKKAVIAMCEMFNTIK